MIPPGRRSVRASLLLGAALAAALAPGAARGEGDPCAALDPILAGSSFVLVRSVAAGERLVAGATVSGCSRTRDGQVAWRLEGRDGRTLASGTAPGGGEGGAAPFAFAVAFELPLAERGTLLLFEAAPGDASKRLPVAALPLVVAPQAPLALFARYLGTLPCADCGGIATELFLYGELEREPRSYRLVETY